MARLQPGVVHNKLARAIHKVASEHVAKGQETHVGTVVSTSPFRVELHTKDVVLQEGKDLHVAQWIHFYHACWGVQVGDNAIVHFSHGVHLWHDLLADTDATPGTAAPAWRTAVGLG